MATSNVTSDIWVPNEGCLAICMEMNGKNRRLFFVKRHAHHCYLRRHLAQAATPNLVAPSLEAVLMGRMGQPQHTPGAYPRQTANERNSQT